MTGSPGGPPPEFVFMVLAVAFLFSALVWLATWAWISWHVSKWIAAIPPEYRQEGLEPWHPWLLLIPLFNLFWHFKVLPVVARSFQVALADDALDDCGEQNAQYFAIATLASFVLFFIPFISTLNIVVGPAASVLLILTLVKLYDCRNYVRILHGEAA